MAELHLPRGLVLFAAVTLAAVMLPSAVTAKPNPSGQGKNCVLQVEYVEIDSADAEVVSESCFPSFFQAIGFATNGLTILSPNATPDTLTQDLLPALALSSVIIGVDWDSTNYVGASRVWTASTGCDFSHWYQVSYVGDAWNDRTESAKGFGGCDKYRHFDAANFGGAVRTCTPTCATMGTMADKTSSEQFDDAL
jgi:hypothetical protein